jgi:dTDP-4-dehydrorhamnose 3,5-epimerase
MLKKEEPTAPDLEGVEVRELEMHADERGWLAELFRTDELDSELHPRMAYVSSTVPGMGRGPHEHRSQTDIFCFMGTTEFKVYLWDNRDSSKSSGEKALISAPEGRITLVRVPPGVVHAYKNVGKNAGLVFNSPNRLYRGECRKEEVDEIRYEDDSASRFRLD